ncbi:MAG: hypothetical protein IT371_18910 [Deltaproteobacteria bacterium]|nr:hypothetical protein [Deltaproteobacteria bacterium]
MTMLTHNDVTTLDPVVLLEERMGALDRTGQRLERILDEMGTLEKDLDRLDQTLFLPGLSELTREELLDEMDLGVAAYNHLREAAAGAYRQLIVQREACGFRHHEVVRRCYAIPELRCCRNDVDSCG